MNEPNRHIAQPEGAAEDAATIEAERRKRSRERLLIVLVLCLIGALTYAGSNILRFGADIPVSNTILMFIIINTNLLLLMLLFFLALRNIVKLVYDRRRKVMGARLRTKLVVAFITLSIVPTVVLFFFSIQFINTSVAFWWSIPVEQSLENSLSVGRQLYDHVVQNHHFFIDRIAYQVKARSLLEERNHQTLCRYVQVAQRAFNLDCVEVYARDNRRLCVSHILAPERGDLPELSPDNLRGETGVRFITLPTPEGQWIRTVDTIPYDVDVEEAAGFVVVSTVLATELSEKMASIARGFEDYQTLKMVKKPIQTSFYITLSIVAALIVFSAIWFGFYLAKSLTGPIRELADGTRRLAGGDLGYTIQRGSDDEMGELVDAFNRMSRDLRASRAELESTASQLAARNVEIEARRQYMEIVLQNVSTGVISFDHLGSITTVNKSAEKMLDIQADNVVGRNFRTLLRGEHLDRFREIMEETIEGGRDSVEMPLKVTINQRPWSFMVHFSALRDDRGRFMGMLVVFDDVTEIERAQRMAAWREVARRIAHEVKNPLTPIKLSAQRLSRKFSAQVDDPVFGECTRTIIDQVDLIRNLVNEFSTFARFPAPQPVPSDLPELIAEAALPYREGHPNVAFRLEVLEPPGRMMLDPQQIKRALFNLFDNAISAIGDVPGEIAVTVDYSREADVVHIEIADTGKGFTSMDKEKVFEPYFSTKKAGMGLGLSIVNTIITDHYGTIRVVDNHPRGARFIIEMPAQPFGE
ncbi:MAG: sensor histidine kinase [Desulfatibacillaceae bacterium]